jgi:Phage protein
MREASQNQLASVFFTKNKIFNCVTAKFQVSVDKASMSLLDELSNEELAKLTGAHITSVRRWRRRGSLPKPISKLLEFVAQNRLDHWGWKGWVFQDGKLTSPDGLAVTSGEVQAIQLHQQQLAHYQAQDRLWKSKANQPVEDGAQALKRIRA